MSFACIIFSSLPLSSGLTFSNRHFTKPWGHNTSGNFLTVLPFTPLRFCNIAVAGGLPNTITPCSLSVMTPVMAAFTGTSAGRRNQSIENARKRWPHQIMMKKDGSVSIIWNGQKPNKITVRIDPKLPASTNVGCQTPLSPSRGGGQFQQMYYWVLNTANTKLSD